MANDVVSKTSPLPPALVQKIADGLARSYGGTSHALRSGLPIVKLDKSGKGWSYGQDNIPLPQGALLQVDTGSFQHGIVVWYDSKIVHEEMVEGWLDAPPIPSTPHPTGQPYKRQSQVKLRIIDGKDADTELLYKISSDGGNERLAELGRLAGARIGQYADSSPYLYPVIQLGQDYYDNKQYGSRIYKPIFALVGWADVDGNMEEPGDNVVAIQPPAAESKPAKPANPAEAASVTGQRRRPGR